MSKSIVAPFESFKAVDFGDGRAVLIRLEDGRAFVSISELARWCEVDRTTISRVLRKPIKELEPLQEEASFSVTKIRNPESPTPWTVIPVDEAYSVLFYYAFDARGHESRIDAKTLTRQMGKAGATVYAYGLCGYTVKPSEPSIPIAHLVLRQHSTWERRFSPEWIQNAERVTGYKWSYRIMAKFINAAVYDSFPAEVRSALDDYNPIDQNGNRPRRQHQHLAGDAIEFLDARIAVTLTLLHCSDSQEEFFNLLAVKDRGLKQLNLRLSGGAA